MVPLGLFGLAKAEPHRCAPDWKLLAKDGFVVVDGDLGCDPETTGRLEDLGIPRGTFLVVRRKLNAEVVELVDLVDLVGADDVVVEVFANDDNTRHVVFGEVSRLVDEYFNSF